MAGKKMVAWEINAAGLEEPKNVYEIAVVLFITKSWQGVEDSIPSRRR